MLSAPREPTQLLELADVASTQLNDIYSHLKLRGNLLPVLVRDVLVSSTYSSHLFDLGGEVRNFGPKSCGRYIYIDTSPDSAGGFGLFEHPEFEELIWQKNILAFHVLTEKYSMEEGLNFGQWYPFNHRVYVILMIEAGRAGTNHFERVGVAKMWEKNVEKDFQRLSVQDIILV